MVAAGRILESSEISDGNGIQADVGSLAGLCVSMKPESITGKTLNSKDKLITLGTSART